MRVKQKMTAPAVTVAPNDTLEKAAAKMNAGKFRRLPVVERGKLVGIVTDRDLRQHIGQLAKTKVRAVMSENVVTVSPLTTLEHAAHLMLQHRIGGMPVLTEDGTVAGIVTTSDLLGAFLNFVGADGDDSSRIDVSLDGGASRMANAADIAVQQAGQVLGLGTYRVAGEENPVFYLRVRTDDIDGIVSALEDRGFNVLAVHP
jgi:acetoin utilization protein AcuB